MKFLSAALAFSFIILFSSCKKEEEKLPAPIIKCSDFNIRLVNLGTNQLDSFKLKIKNKYGEVIRDSTFINPPSGYEYTTDFCEDNLFELEFFHQQTTRGWEVYLRIMDNDLDLIEINGYSQILGTSALEAKR